ncbi:uncharacterized protein DNG_01129 [Cephalotrichum gorgonifer]|uniref:Uncharacterized protein n=1 Tax=Cephalotrichum gorgonifer TaxID=2041049 RepID=A0AAE8SRJ9_9PEZI|nr:uncharacterized protein DNG_01129 [Cephalotrichum gorgonifer]
MGRQGPLTALALVCRHAAREPLILQLASYLPGLEPISPTDPLANAYISLKGRSPYDDVVQGEGEEDTRGPTQMYDEKGRPVNPETKRLNREIVRSHNEVMHVIGVAEPDPSSNDAEILAARRYMLYEQIIGERMGRLNDTLMEVGVWGFWGLRRRVMVYKPFSYKPFWKLATTCREEIPRPLTGLLLAGLPTQLAWKALDWLKNNFIGRLALPEPLWILEECLGAYIHTHLAAYIFLQRSGIISEFRLPGPAFFIPFTPSSPISAPSPPADLSVSSILAWCGAAAINVGPILLVALWRKLYSRAVASLGLTIFLRLPYIKLIIEPQTAAADTIPDPAALFQRSGGEPAEESGTAETPGSQRADSSEEGGQQSSQNNTSGASRRPSAFSGRGDDYGSEEEDNGAISGTLISFDVEATESADAAPQGAQGVWSAELRPTAGTDGRSQGGQQAVYLRNALSKQPLVHAAKILSRLATCILLSPLEATAYRTLARSYGLRRGLSMSQLWEPSFFGTVNWAWAANYLAVELLHFSLQSDIWAGVTFLGRSYHLTPEAWSEMTPEEHAGFVRGFE